ncbi:MAG: hypothetical protein IPP91_11615 [Betaproteobacteria bacterium]|nr:hypothetical protein [Betaproteobacteria bacterium]
MAPPFRERGIALVAIAAILAIAVLTALTAAIARSAAGPRRAAITDQALATAREALTAHATSRPLDEIVGPGYLPCPDLDDDGWAESTCGSMTGETGQWQRLGRLPWKTLGLPDLRDAHGERLWYAVSSKHKGLLNCTVSPACLDMSPEAALGTITIRDASGTVIHDGTSPSPYEPGRGGAVAVIFAPGPPIARWAGNGASTTTQARTCEGGRCNAAGHCLTSPPTLTPKCNPANYLDRSPGPAYADEDNARFVDRNDAAGRAGNRDGFIHGPIAGRDGTVWVNDRLAVISYDDLMPRVMRRVAEEVSACLRDYAARSENRGLLPWAAPACRSRDPDLILRGSDSSGTLFGRVPDTPFLATVRDSGTTMLGQWAPGCRIADANGSTAGATGFTWWSAWKRHVFYSVAPANRPAPGAPAACDSLTCLFVSQDGAGVASQGRRYAVLVAGPPLLFDSGRQSRSAMADADVRDWLEGANADLRRLNANPAAPECPADLSYPEGPATASYNRVATLASRSRNDVVVTGP